MIPTEKILTNKGKEALFRAIEEYIDAKIENKTVFENFPKTTRLKNAEEDFKNKIMALKIIVEE